MDPLLQEQSFSLLIMLPKNSFFFVLTQSAPIAGYSDVEEDDENGI